MTDYQRFHECEGGTLLKSDSEHEKDLRIDFDKGMFISEFNVSLWRSRQKRDKTLFHIRGKDMNFAEDSLYLMTNKSRLRYQVARLVTSKYFDGFIVALIAIYSVLLGMKDYTDHDNKSQVNKLLHRIDPWFNIIIYFEFLLKIVAMGFVFGTGTYMSDSWNWIDFVVVVSSLSETLLSLADFKGEQFKAPPALRAIRLLRPLRLLSKIPSLKTLLATLIDSLANLSGIMGLAIFFFLIYSILGVSVWQGQIHYRCYLTEKPVDGEWHLYPDYPHLCSPKSSTCPDGSFCGSRFEQFDEDGSRYNFKNKDLWVDTNLEEFNFGLTNFDNIFSSFLTIFIVATMDAWTKIMNMHEDFFSSFFVHTFFISCVWIISFFILNLTIATMLMKYEQVEEENKQNKHSHGGDEHDHDSADLDIFEKELLSMGEKIFQKEHLKVLDFIIDYDGIKVDEGCYKHLNQQEQSAWSLFFQEKTYQVDRAHPYYQKPVVKKCLEIISSKYFDGLIMFVIIANTFTMMLDGYPKQGDNVLSVIEVFNLLFFIVFTGESAIRITALGWKEFKKDAFNLFDLFIVLNSVIYRVMKMISPKNQGGGFILILRTIRVFRIFKLFKAGDMRVLLDSIIFTMTSIGPYITLLGFFMYIFALVGMSFFAGKIKFDEDGEVDLVNGKSPRENFDKLSNSLLTIFIVIIGSDWSPIMYSYMRCQGHLVAIFFILIQICGTIILLNLFLAIMLGNFGKAKTFATKKKVLEAFDQLLNHPDQEQRKNIFEACDIVLGNEMSNHVLNKVLKLKKPANYLLRRIVNMFGKDVSKGTKDIEEKQRLQSNKFFQNASLYCFHIDWKIRKVCLTLSENQEDLAQVMALRQEAQQSQKDKFTDGDKDSQARKSRVNQYFENFILLLIILSSITLPFDNPLNDPESEKVRNLNQINMVFTVIFVIEASVKIIAKGLIQNNMGVIKPYLSSGWNRVDAFIVTISVADLVMMQLGSGSQFAALKAFRSLRALRPLRVIKRFENLKLIVNALFATFQAMQSVINVATLITLIFAIMGVSLFKGEFFSCQNDGTISQDLMDSIITKQDCLDLGGKWVNEQTNFDNFFNAMSALFQMMTTEGWQGLMFKGMDATGIDMQPKKDHNKLMFLYFIGFMIVGSLFIINLFVGVVIDNFNEIKEQNELGSGFITQSQKQWIYTQKVGQALRMRKSAVRPEDPTRRKFFDLVNSEWFVNSITLCVVINVLCMASKSYQINSSLALTLKSLNAIFTLIFNLEMILKLIALKWMYFYNIWNQFDCFLVFITDLGLLLDYIGIQSQMGTGFTILRAFRILRIVKVLQRFKSVRVIIGAFLNIIPNISNVMALFLLILFIYACVGINLFAKVKPLDNVNKYNNFQTFPGAMLILLRFSTGEDWNAFMYEYSNQENCQRNQSYDDIQSEGIQGCGTSLSYFFFFSFQILVVMLILNLAIAAVIDGLQAAQADDERVIKNDSIDKVLEAWSFYDPFGKGKITIDAFYFFMVEIGPPFGNEYKLKTAISSNDDGYFVNTEKGYMVRARSLMTSIKDLQIKTHREADNKIYVTFADVFKTLTERAFQSSLKGEYVISDRKLSQKFEKGWQQKSENLKKTASHVDNQIDENDQEIIQKSLAVSIISQKFIQKLKKKRAERAASKMEVENQTIQ